MAAHGAIEFVRHRSPHEVLEHYQRERSPADKEWLVERFLPLALHLARRYRPHGDREDVEQVATLGLLKAIERFDPVRGVAFTSFAVPTIAGEVKRYFRELGWMVRVPRRGTATAHFADSLDAPACHSDQADAPVAELRAEEPGFARAERRADLDHLLSVLCRRDELIVRLRFLEELTQREATATRRVQECGEWRHANYAVTSTSPRWRSPIAARRTSSTRSSARSTRSRRLALTVGAK